MTTQIKQLEEELDCQLFVLKVKLIVCYSDSNSCQMKLGMIGETIVNLIFSYDRIPLP